MEKFRSFQDYNERNHRALFHQSFGNFFSVFFSVHFINVINSGNSAVICTYRKCYFVYFFFSSLFFKFDMILSTLSYYPNNYSRFSSLFFSKNYVIVKKRMVRAKTIFVKEKWNLMIRNLKSRKVKLEKSIWLFWKTQITYEDFNLW